MGASMHVKKGAQGSGGTQKGLRWEHQCKRGVAMGMCSVCLRGGGGAPDGEVAVEVAHGGGWCGLLQGGLQVLHAHHVALHPRLPRARRVERHRHACGGHSDRIHGSATALSLQLIKLHYWEGVHGSFLVLPARSSSEGSPTAPDASRRQKKKRRAPCIGGKTNIRSSRWQLRN